MRSAISSSASPVWDDASKLKSGGRRVSSHSFLSPLKRCYPALGSILCRSSDFRSSIQSKRMACSSWRLLTIAVGLAIGSAALAKPKVNLKRAPEPIRRWRIHCHAWQAPRAGPPKPRLRRAGDGKGCDARFPQAPQR